MSYEPLKSSNHVEPPKPWPSPIATERKYMSVPGLSNEEAGKPFIGPPVTEKTPSVIPALLLLVALGIIIVAAIGSYHYVTRNEPTPAADPNIGPEIVYGLGGYARITNSHVGKVLGPPPIESLEGLSNAVRVYNPSSNRMEWRKDVQLTPAISPAFVQQTDQAVFSWGDTVITLWQDASTNHHVTITGPGRYTVFREDVQIANDDGWLVEQRQAVRQERRAKGGAK